jgi:CheY-like chemotaxis protein
MTLQKTILVVDDSQEIREGLTALLGKRGYRALAAEDGWEACQLIEEQSPDLVILDMMMPRWGGLAVLEHFRGAERMPPFIVITANEGARHQQHVERLGAVDFVRKPFELRRLLEGVTKVLGTPAVEEAATPESGPAVAALRCTCPGCGARIKAPSELVGQSRPCPRCNQPFVIGAKPPADEDAILVHDAGPARVRPR